MTTPMYEQVRRNLFGGHNQNAFLQLLQDRAAIRAPMQGTPEEFSQVLYELTEGELGRRHPTVSYEVVEAGKKDLLKFQDGSLFRVVRAKGRIGGTLIVATPYLPSMDDLIGTRELPLLRLVTDALMIRDAFKSVADEYRRVELRSAAERAGAEIRMARESRLETVVETIERAKSGETVMVRGLQNIEALVELGFVPGLVDNPDNWIDAEDFPGMRYRHARSGIEVLLTARERFRPIEELSKLEFTFLVHRSDDDPAAFGTMVRKYRGGKGDGSVYSLKELQADLVALVKYPEELKGRTEEDLGLMADEVERVIDHRQELDKGILPYEAVFSKDTRAIIEAVKKNGTPAREIRKALDYCEYTGMIDAQYKATLLREITAATAAMAGQKPAAPVPPDVLYDKRVKEIVAEVLRKIPKERLTPVAITVALTPYVSELGFGRLVKIRERILQLKEMVHAQ